MRIAGILMAVVLSAAALVFSAGRCELEQRRDSPQLSYTAGQAPAAARAVIGVPAWKRPMI